jgi:putative photosynthetic complex assembly protein
MSHSHNQQFPRGALFGAAGLIMIALLSAGLSHIVGTKSMVPTSSPVAVRDLRFEDRADGGVDVYDSNGLSPADTVLPGSNAFLRATLRGLAQQRKREGDNDAVPFRLTAWADGRLTLDDKDTGRHIELEAFGPTNAAAFARFLPVKVATR